MVKKIFFISLIIIGIFLRVYEIGEIPSGLFMDETTIAVDAKTIAQNGFDQYGRSFPFYFESLSDFRLPGYVYSTALVYKFLGPTTLTIRLMALISSILSIFLLGYFTKLLFPNKKYLPLYAMGILAISPFHIHFSRIGYETMLATTLILIYFISLIKLFSKPNIKWTILGSACALAAIWTYPSIKLELAIINVLLLLLSIINITFGQNRKNIFIYTLYFLGIGLIGLIPGFLNPLADKRSLNYISEGTDGTLFGILREKPRMLLSSWLFTFDFNFLFKKGDLFAYRHGTKEQGIFLEIFVIPFILGLINLIKNFSKKSFSIPFLIILLLALGFPSALTSPAPYGTRILPIIIPLSIIIALGVELIIEYLNKLNKPIRYSILLIATGILIFEIWQFQHIYFFHFKTTSLPEFPKAPIELSQYIKEFGKTNPNNEIYFLNDKSCRNWSFDSLYLWYFADLNNSEMVKWNNIFRTERYNYGSPFDAYDNVTIPSYTIGKIVLYPGYKKMEDAKPGTLLIRCGIHASGINQEKEEIIKVFYLFEYSKSDPFYVVSKKL